MSYQVEAADGGGRRAATATAQLPRRPAAPLMAVRGAVVFTRVLCSVLPAQVSGLAVSMVRGWDAGRAHRYGRTRKLLEHLGPTYVKFGQIMSGRRDVLPSGLCDELAVLHDHVSPMSRGQAERALASVYGEDLPRLFADINLDAVASGSIACVYRATLHDGRPVAVKLRRPDISSRMAKDLGLLENAARLAERLPKCRGMPIGDLTGYLSTAILGQLDLEREAVMLARLGSCIAGIAGVRVPSVIAEASRPGCLVMDFIEDLDVDNVTSHSPSTRDRLARTTLEAAGKLLFHDGFVHCDLHPGNLYVTTAGDIVVLDAGFSAELPDEVRELIGEFFIRLSLGDGRRCAEIILASAADTRPELDADGFVAAVAALVAAKAGPAVQDFTMMPFGNELFDLQRDFGIYAKSDFAFPLMSLGVLESTVRGISATVDFQEVGRLRLGSSSSSDPAHSLRS